MATLIISALYWIIIITYILISLFIIYHIAKYSINPVIKVFSLTLFSIVAGGLLISNLALFESVNWSSLTSGMF